MGHLQLWIVAFRRQPGGTVGGQFVMPAVADQACCAERLREPVQVLHVGPQVDSKLHVLTSLYGQRPFDD